VPDYNFGIFLKKHFLSGSKGLLSDITIWIVETNASIISNPINWSMKLEHMVIQ